MDALTRAVQPPIVTTERERSIRKTHSAGRAAADDFSYSARNRASRTDPNGERRDRAGPPTPGEHRCGDEAGRRVWYGDATLLGRLGTGPVDAVSCHRSTGYGRRFGRVVRDD